MRFNIVMASGIIGMVAFTIWCSQPIRKALEAATNEKLAVFIMFIGLFGAVGGLVWCGQKAMDRDFEDK